MMTDFELMEAGLTDGVHSQRHRQVRIAHLTSAHARDDVRIFLKECRSLATHGHSVALVVADGRGDEVKGGISIHDVGQSQGRLSRMIGTVGKIYRKALALNADVYHLHDPELLMIGLRLRRGGKKVVFDAHEDVPKQILAKHYLHPWARRAISWVYGVFERHVCRSIDAVVAATPSIRDKFESINGCVIDVNNYPILGELECDEPWSVKGAEVCYVGSIAEIRGIKELVKSLELTQSKARLNLVGSFSDRQVEVEVRSYPGWGRVNDFGVQDRRGVRRVLGRSVAGLVTLHPVLNYLDALPIKMFEYMAAGIPVIASDFDLWRTIVEDSGCGICVDPKDVEAIASAIDFFLSNPFDAQAMGSRGREAVIRRYNWAQEEAKLLSFYRGLMAPGRGA